MYSPGRLCIRNLCTTLFSFAVKKCGLVAVKCYKLYIYHSGVFHNLYQSLSLIVICAFAKPQKCLLASLFLSVRPSLRTYQFDSHWTFCVSLYITVNCSTANISNFKTECIQLCNLLGCSPGCSSFLRAVVVTDVIMCLASNYLHCLSVWAVLWLGWLVASLSPRSPGFFPWPVLKGYMVDEMVMEHVFLRVLRFFLLSIIYPVIHIHILFTYLWLNTV